MIVVDGAVFDFVDGVLCARWWAVTDTGVDAYIAFVDESAGRGKAMAPLWAVETSVRPPPAAVRQRMVDLTVRHEDATACGAFIVEGSGMFASAMRGIVTSVNFLARTKKPNHVGQDLAVGAAFIAEQLKAPKCPRPPSTIDPAALLAAHEQLRASRRARASR